MFYYLKIYLFAPFRDEEIKRIFAFRKFLRSAQSHAVKHICPLRGLLSKLIIILIPPTGYNNTLTLTTPSQKHHLPNTPYLTIIMNSKL